MSNKRKSFKALIMMCLMVVMMFGSTITAFAGDFSDVQAVADAYGPGSGNQQPSVMGYLHLSNSGSYTEPITCKDYYDPTQSSAIIEAGNKLADAAAKGAAAQQEVKNYSDQIGNLGLTADVTTATGMLSGFMGVLRTLLGILVVIISVGMTVFSAFDLCYIAFPVFRNKCEDAKTNGGIMAKKGSNGEAKLRFVSDDAQYAVVAADTTQSGKNPFVIYFGKRLISYLVLAILLFILLTGKVTVFTDIAIRLVSGLINLLQTL